MGYNSDEQYIDMGFEWFVSNIIRTELMKLCPQLDLNGVDAIVFNNCIQDFRLFMEFLRRYHESPSTITIMKVGHITLKWFSPPTDEILEFVPIWVRQWWRQYKSKVKITLKTPKKNKTFEAGKQILTKHFTEAEKQDIIKMMQMKFIRNGIIVFLKPLSEITFISVLGRTRQKNWTKEAKMQFIYRILQECKRVARMGGPILFIHPTSRYFAREWRDRGSIH